MAVLLDPTTTNGLAPVVMVQGCTSDAGKSLLTAALCRWFVDRGVKVAPFKAQNMSNNAAVCIDGSEIGRAQYLQAIAARVQPDVRMNPVLLKPTADTSSSVIMMGRPAAELTTIGWLERRSYMWPVVTGALRSLRAEFDLVIAEGAGSPAEVNLRPSDIVNMAVALEANALVYLVADIDRGGAFAHLLGTVECLSAQERALVRGFVLNKFQGDASLLSPATEWLLERSGIPTIGVVPWLRHRVPDEDRLLLHNDSGLSGGAPVKRIALISYPWASNFDEFEGLAAVEGIEVDIIRERFDLRAFDAVVLPGSRNTVASLAWLRSNGLAAEVSAAARSGVVILGICGGMQMLGTWINDPLGLESGGEVGGLGLLDVQTELTDAKTTRQVNATVTDTGEIVMGYEIHHGVTTASPGVAAELDGGLGWVSGNVTGVYVHGLLDDATYLRRFLRRVGIEPTTLVDRGAALDTEFDQLARSVDATGWPTRIARDLGFAHHLAVG
ncbi:MAG: cobyric acid synthase [Acidimicrobiales bacterium]